MSPQNRRSGTHYIVTRADVKDRLKREDSGATAVEYGLLVGLIAVVIIAALLLLGPKLAGLFTKVNTSLTTT